MASSLFSRNKGELTMAEIIRPDQLREISNTLKSNGKKIVLTGGCFDILHIGHITLLENAKKEGDILMVMLESDESIKAKKGINRPIHSQEQRAHMLSALQFVDYVILLPSSLSDRGYDTVVKDTQPDIIATTFGDPYAFHKERQARETGSEVVFVNKLEKDISTTRILDLLIKEL